MTRRLQRHSLAKHSGEPGTYLLTTSDPPARSPAPAHQTRTRALAATVPSGRTFPTPPAPVQTRAGLGTAFFPSLDVSTGSGCPQATMPSPPLSHPGREGSFRPVTKVNMDMIRGAYERFTAEHILKTAMQPGKAWCHKK